MDLVGANQYVDHDGDNVWDPIDGNPPTPTSNYVLPGTETVIDGRNLTVFIAEAPMVEMGRDNRLEGLTVKNFGSVVPSDVARKLIGKTTLPGNTLRRMTIVDCLVDDDFPDTSGRRGGIACTNVSPEQDGAITECTLIGNIVRNFRTGPIAIQVSNAQGVSDAKVFARLKYNRSEFNAWGLILGKTGRPSGDGNEARAVSIGHV
jgi:hypothetical protein